MSDMPNRYPRLHTAAWEGRLEDVRRFLAAGDDVDGRSSGGTTALHFACWQGHERVVVALLNHGADISMVDDAGYSPLHHALRNGHHAVGRLLRARGAQLTIYDAVGLGNTSEMLRLLDRDPALANARLADGTTPLFCVNSAGAARELIARGAEVNARDEGGCTPLHAAAGVGLVDVVRLLLERGADPHAETHSGHTPLDWASIEAHEQCIALLAAAETGTEREGWGCT